MKLKEIKPGMAVKCRTKEEATALWTWFYDNGYIRYGNGADGLDNFIRCFPECCFGINKSENSWDAYGENEKDVEKVEFSDLIISEMTAEEAFSILGEIRKCGGGRCSVCPLCSSNNDGDTYCSSNYGVNVSDGVRLLEICQQWKADHEKKEPEIETVDICRIIEIQPDGRKRCVYEEDMDMGPDFPTGEEWIEVEKILKRYCMEHDGEFIAVHETVSRVKQVAGKLETHGNARNRTCALLD